MNFHRDAKNQSSVTKFKPMYLYIRLSSVGSDFHVKEGEKAIPLCKTVFALANLLGCTTTSRMGGLEA